METVPIGCLLRHTYSTYKSAGRATSISVRLALTATGNTNLVNGTGNETVYIFVGSKDLGEGSAEGWGCLDCRESHLADVVTVTETKYAFGLVHCHTLLNL